MYHSSSHYAVRYARTSESLAVVETLQKIIHQYKLHPNAYHSLETTIEGKMQKDISKEYRGKKN